MPPRKRVTKPGGHQIGDRYSMHGATFSVASASLPVVADVAVTLILDCPQTVTVFRRNAGNGEGGATIDLVADGWVVSGTVHLDKELPWCPPLRELVRKAAESKKEGHQWPS